MARSLIDLLWRDHLDAPSSGKRGPKSRLTTGAVVDTATDLADREGLTATTIRRLGEALGVATMSVYTHVNSRDDLLVLMADAANATRPPPAYGRAGWQTRVRRLAEADLAHYRAHPWLLDVRDQRTALGPGTIAKYDHDLQAFDPLGLGDVARDAALTFVLDFVRASAQAQRPDPDAGELAAHWPEWSASLAAYVGTDYPLAQRVGAAAGEAQQAAYSPAHAWEFGLERVIAGLAELRWN